jgi:site-specific DNA-adenine methylase
MNPNPSSKQKPEASPLITWPGSKRALASQLAPSILEALDPERGRYFEPFLGSAAVYLQLRAEGFGGRCSATASPRSSRPTPP